ncbi:MAG: class I SAM-dependent methyltransferase [Pontiellaceae bacterium]|nr:class I SAM-dependent methyltransferase [Pontiellaceae bacterium]MBN2785233.1 class I SAM-dependent methyltransferase [Pontiellaceae bacterium]
MSHLMELAEKGCMPDTAIRAGIRRLLRDRLRRECVETAEQQLEKHYRFIENMKAGPVAVATDTANEQHYEVPARFFETFMGPHMKYSCGYWPEEQTTLQQAEEAMLELTAQRAGLKDDMEILELGCGWGSLSLWMAQRFPKARITAISNSQTQKNYIDARGLPNLEIITADMNDFNTKKQFDRVVSVEMFEHMRNWPELLRRIRGWLKEDGKLFIHIFVHRDISYLFNDSGKVNWMADHFFKEGMMPSENLPFMLNDDLLVERHWRVNGRHYARTLRAWLDNIDRNHAPAIAWLDNGSTSEALIRYGRWRIFFMACEELFGFREGEEWYVAHYLFKKR